ncbi:hypothetical protein WA026_011653 [Henosepilachna vigintioctopunctata]|uniref:Uncharacterized protein n=1 Tax=Henosepilachna vigintioctopunctata TaxID=420089 RepID=A0AAW1TUB0_9CUCU
MRERTESVIPRARSAAVANLQQITHRHGLCKDVGNHGGRAADVERPSGRRTLLGGAATLMGTNGTPAVPRQQTNGMAAPQTGAFDVEKTSEDDCLLNSSCTSLIFHPIYFWASVVCRLFE